MWGFEIAVICTMIAVNSVFAAYELALASVSRARLHVLVREGRRGAATALRMKENIEGSLAVVQLGITLVGAIAAATGGAGAEENLVPWLQAVLPLAENVAEALALAIIVIPLTGVTIVLGELVPKVFALRNQEWVCLRLSPLMRGFALAAWPVVWLLEGSTTLLMKWGERRWSARPDAGVRSETAELQELRASASLARTSRLIGAQEERIILAAAALSRRTVREIMLPAEHISLLPLDASLAEALVAAHLEMHTRFPVTERRDDPQAIVGYVNFKDLVNRLRLAPQEPTLRGILRPIPSFYETALAPHCLEQMIRDHVHIALVRNAADRVLGMFTLEDILEELLGDIEDEFDRLPAHATPAGRGWIVGGGVPLPRLRTLTGLPLPDVPGGDGGPRRFSDWITARLGRPVELGEIMEWDGVRIVVRKVRRKKVQEAQLERLATAEP